jgi:hypothetical protein
MPKKQTNWAPRMGGQSAESSDWGDVCTGGDDDPTWDWDWDDDCD